MTQSRPGCKALLQPWEYHEMQKVGYPSSLAGASSQSTAWPVKNGICLDFVCLILGSGSVFGALCFLNDDQITPRM